MTPDQAPRPSCASCGTPLTGPFCAECGEATLTPESRTVRHFIGASLLDEIVQFDSRFWRTISALLFAPGRLTLEFIAGRRRPYIGPVKLLLASIFVFVLATRGGFASTLMLGPIVLSVAPAVPPPDLTFRQTLIYFDRFGVLDAELGRRFGSAGPNATAQARFQDRMQRVAEPLSFGNVFFVGLGLYLLFRRRLPFYVDHLVFSAHIISFVLLSSLVLLPAYWYEESIGSAALVPVFAVLVWQFAYLTLAIRRMYFAHVDSRFAARLRAFGVAWLIYVFNAVFVTMVQLLAGWIAIQQM